MIKSTLTVAILSSCIASTSFAFNMLHPMHKLHNAAKTQVKNNIQTKNESFTDFSNTWTGTCRFDSMEGIDPVTLTIENDAYGIEIDGQYYSLQGQLSTESTANTAETNYNHFSLHWNPEQTQIMLNGVSVELQHDGSGTLVTTVGGTTFSLVNGQLVMDGHFNVAPLTVEDSGSHTYQCTFNKAG